MPGVTTASGSRSPTSTIRDTCADGHGGRGRHHRPEVAGGPAVHQIPQPVAEVRADQRDVTADRVFQHVVAAVDGAGLPALGQRRADPGGAVERADPGAGRAHPLGQIALRDQLQLDLPGAVQAVEHVRVGLARERADHLAHPSRGQQCGQPGVAVAGVVADDGQFPGALLDQRVDQPDRHPGHAEAADQHGGAVLDPRHRFGRGADDLAHDDSPSGSASTRWAIRKAVFAAGTPQ